MPRTYEAMQQSDSLPDSFDIDDSSPAGWEGTEFDGQQVIAELAQRLVIDTQSNGVKISNFMCSRKGEGTSTVLVNIANHIKDNSAFGEILLVDGNFRHPVLHRALGAEKSPGLWELLTNNADLTQCAQRVGSGNLFLLASGAPPAPALARIDQVRLADLTAALRDRFQHVLIDSPPLLVSSDAVTLSKAADISYFIIKSRETPYEVVEKAKNQLTEHECRLGGVILNNVIQPIPDWLYKRL